MSRYLRPITLLLSAAVIAGCGSSSAPTPPTAGPAKSAPVQPGGQLRVGATDIQLGDATTGGSDGLRVLPKRRVPGDSNTQQGVGAGASCEGTEIIPSPDNLADVVGSTLCLLNGERADAGLGGLGQNPQLAQAAMDHSREMVNRQFFDHVGRDGSDPVDRIRTAGYIPTSGTWTVGENLAWGTGTLATPKAIVAAWMKSQGHRENILRPAFKEIGFGVVSGNPRSGSGAGATFTTTFGAVTGSSAAPAPTAKKSRKARRKARKARTARRARASRRTARSSGRR